MYSPTLALVRFGKHLTMRQAMQILVTPMDGIMPLLA
jgi:hypothetical protein